MDRPTRVLALVLGVALIAAAACVPSASDGPTSVQPHWGFSRLSCNVAQTGQSSGTSISETGTFNCAGSDQIACAVVDANYISFFSGNPPSSVLWARQQPRTRLATPRFFGVTNLSRTQTFADNVEPDYNKSPNSDAIYAAVGLLSSIDGRSVIVISTVDYDPYFACPDRSPRLTTTWSVPRTFVCTQYNYVSALGVPLIWEYDLGWCDSHGNLISRPEPAPITPVPQFIRGNIPSGFNGEARVCNPIGTTASPFGNPVHWAYGSPSGSWFNIAPKDGDDGYMTARIGGVPFYVPRADLCTAIGDGGVSVPYGYSGRGYVCNNTGTVGVFLANRFYAYENRAVTYHDIRPAVDSGVTSTDHVVMWDQGVPLVTPRADVCQS